LRGRLFPRGRRPSFLILLGRLRVKGREDGTGGGGSSLGDGPPGAQALRRRNRESRERTLAEGSPCSSSARRRADVREPVLLRAMKRLYLLIAGLVVAAPAAAQAPADTARTHVVRPGDTLWDLAGRYLANPFRWSEIFGVNRDVVEDPHWIYPAERLRIPGAVMGSVAAVA